jgi:phosphatidylglycerophosphatase A
MIKDKLVRFIATGIYSGYSPLVPGTVGSIPAWLIAFFLIGDNTPVLAVVTVVTFCVSVWSAGKVEQMFGHDAKKIVIDEWTGMFLALLFVPYSFSNYLIAFFAFRAFDVLKLPPAAQAERLPGGWGVTMDDVIAGIQANVLTQLVIFAFAWLTVG